MLCWVGCHNSSGSGHGQGTLPVNGEKKALLDLVQRQFLWNTTVPAQVDVDAHATLPDLLEHLTAPARAMGKEQSGWSRLEKAKTSSSLSAGPGQGTGWGAIMELQGTKVFIKHAMPGSGSHRAGLGRGDEVLAAGLTAQALGQPSSSVQALLASGDFLNVFVGKAGSVRHVRVKKAGTGLVRDLAVTFDNFTYDLVPGASRPSIFQAGPNHKVGYLQLLEFQPAAEDQLRAAMRHFQQAGVTDFVLDLRYNGGGDLQTAELLCNLLRGTAANPGAVMAKLKGNANVQDQLIHFSVVPEAIHPVRIAIITTANSASASETLVNALQPYYRQNLAIVGARTYGKPVAQEHVKLPHSDWVLVLTKYRVLNAQDHGDFWKGLPDAGFLGSSCAADDDLTHALGDPTEASLHAALGWIRNGTSPNGPIPQAGSTAAAVAATRTPLALPAGSNPNIPGLY